MASKGDEEAGGVTSNTVFQIVLDDGSGGTAVSDAVVSTADGGINLIQTSIMQEPNQILPVQAADGSGEITYIQVDTDAAGGTATVGGEDDAVGAGMIPADETAVAVVDPDVHSQQEPQQNHFILQSPPNYKFELLQYIESTCRERFFDFPVFCQDGVAWSSRLILTAISPLMKRTLLEMPEADTCLILPELTRLEFSTFQNALFAAEEDDTLDFVVLIKVAEVIGAELALTTSFPVNEDPFPKVNYSAMLDNRSERKRIYRSLGYEVDGAAAAGPASSAAASSSVDALSQVLHSDVRCEICDGVYVDEVSLRKHHRIMHGSQSVSEYLGHGKSYICGVCKKSFHYAVNLKKHTWLVHEKPARYANHLAAPLDRDTIKSKRMQEKMDDMRCNLCGFEAKSWKQLQVHMLDHSDHRPYKCDTCGKGFKEQQKLRRHQVIHTGEKNHKCQFCGKAFGLRHNMRAHERIHMGQGHQCKYCGKMYSQMSNLKEHERLHKSAGHKVTEDSKLQEKQTFEKARGRPSIQDMDLKRRRLEEEEAGVDDDPEEEAEAAASDVSPASPPKRATRTRKK